MRKKIIIAVLIIGILIIGLCINLRKKDGDSILYSWSIGAVEDKNLFEIMKKHNIGTLYQDFTSKYLKEKDDSFLKKATNRNIEVYHLCGDPEWGLEKNASSMIAEIKKVIAFNETVDYKIKGIVFDVEPYQNAKDVKNDFDFSLYVSNMKKAYQYAKNEHLKMVIVIPIWFDTIDKSKLEDLIKNGCDEVSLMNYNIKNTKKNMKTEIQYAKKYDKEINTIYEINFSDKNYFKSYEEIDLDFRQIKEKYSYSKLRKAYHHYTKMKET